ncbi:MAG: IS66 family transposase [Acidobacteriaceae bacterium]|nr:IS66 family transposase [Acidobacteriaceae bacterium]
MKKRSLRRSIEIDLEELDQVIDRATRTPLAESDARKLKTALHAMAERLKPKRTTEKTSAVTPGNSPAQPLEREGCTSAGHGRHGAADFTHANKVSVAHPTLASGDRCPDCGKGKVYLQKEPATLVRIVGQAPLAATVFEMERLRCNACGQIFQAPEPVTGHGEKYHMTAVAMMALLKYGTGMPFRRIERLQLQLGMPLPAATQWELMETAAGLLRLVLEELIRQGAQGTVLHNDDTAMRVLRLVRDTADKRNGVFTSGIISVAGGWKIALFFTGVKHAGENMAEVLKRRARELPPPIQMCDALSRNTPKLEGIKVVLANCLAHGRRHFVEVVENFPEECRYVLETLRAVYHNDALTRQNKLSPAERLRFHQEQSGPPLESLQEWMQAQFSEHKTEPNSGLGRAISYMLNHWEKLTLFLRAAGAPLDNNVVERALKMAILHRKNAFFYKTRNGASVGDLFMSLIHTCALNGVNPFEYLTELLRNSAAARAHPAGWMPWNYRASLPVAA